ncbi:uncharacterized protein LOC144099156 isoform X2 [Amblyomma americanum]
MDVAHSFSACSSSSQASLGMHPSVSSVLPDSLVLLEYVKQEPPSDTESTDRSLAGTSAVQPEPSHALIRSEGTSGIQGGRGCHQTSSGSHMQTSVHNGYSVFEHASGKHRKNRVARRPCCSEPDTARSWSHSQTSSQRQVPSATCFVLPCININITNGNFIVNVNSPRFNVPTHNHSGRNNSPTDEQDARTSKSCDECCPTARDYAERAQSPSHTSQQSSYGCRDRRFSHCHSPCNCVRHR